MNNLESLLYWNKILSNWFIITVTVMVLIQLFIDLKVPWVISVIPKRSWADKLISVYRFLVISVFFTTLFSLLLLLVVSTNSYFLKEGSCYRVTNIAINENGVWISVLRSERDEILKYLNQSKENLPVANDKRKKLKLLDDLIYIHNNEMKNMKNSSFDFIVLEKISRSNIYYNGVTGMIDKGLTISSLWDYSILDKNGGDFRIPCSDRMKEISKKYYDNKKRNILKE